MSWIENFHFLRPAWLLAAPVIVIVWRLARKSQDPLRGWRLAMDADLLDAATVGRSDPSWRAWAPLLTWLLAVVAIAGPTWRSEPSPFMDDPVPVMLVLRADETMNQTDMMPSRIERARLKIADFANQRKGQPLGLVVFAGTAHLVLPPTRDTAVVAAMAAEISPEVMPRPGDDLAGAIELARTTIGDEGGSLLLVADDVNELNAQELEQIRATNGLPIHVWAIARSGTTELEALESAASALGAKTTIMTADSTDVQLLVRSTARTPVAARIAGKGVRWAEDGWRLTPLIAVLSLFGFQRVCDKDSTEVKA